jgi:hypothetical protein
MKGRSPAGGGRAGYLAYVVVMAGEGERIEMLGYILCTIN